MRTSKIIYLVDDDADDVMLIREALQDVINDVRIIEVADGKELLDLISLQDKDSGPELILLDMNMPRMNGLEALSFLKTNPETKHIPVVMVSTTADQHLIRKAYEEGISAFIAKPVAINEYITMAQAVNVCFMNDYRCRRLAMSESYKDKSILVIEDDEDQWHLMKFTLKQSMPDVDIIRMSSKSTTLDFLTDEWNNLKPAPELIIMDLYLPTRREGLNLLDSIRYFFILHKLAAVPIIVFSSSNHEEDIKESYRHRANSYMIRSLDSENSFSSLQNLCHFWWNTITLPKRNEPLNPVKLF